jgi:tol-pal system protein YbgF
MKRYLWVGLLLLSNSVYALFEDEGARKKLNEIQDQLNALQSSIEFQLNEKFTNFEKSNKVDPKLINSLSERINTLFDDLAKLRGEVEVLTYALQTSEERQKVLYKELNERLQKIEDSALKIENNVNSVESAPTNQPLTQNNLIIQEEEEVLPEIAPEPIPQAADLPPLVDKNIEYQEFEDAKKLITATKYKEAFDALDKFVINYPSSELLPEAKYNLGYTQFALRNYKAAINTFNKIVLEYPDNPIAPNSLYQVSNSQIQLTRITKAKQTLRTLIKKYPNADIIPSAKKRLKDLESIKL